MRFFHRQKAAAGTANNTEYPEVHPEPQGHVHPNYRHLTWFRPTKLQGDANS